MLHLLGTDSVGQGHPVSFAWIWQSRLSLAVGFAAVLLGALIGTLVGVVSGFFGGIIEAVAGWLIDVQLSFPFLLLAIFLLGALGGGKTAVICVLALATWVNYLLPASYARSGAVHSQPGLCGGRQAAGADASRIIFVHILP